MNSTEIGAGRKTPAVASTLLSTTAGTTQLVRQQCLAAERGTIRRFELAHLDFSNKLEPFRHHLHVGADDRVAKPAELTPLTALALAELALEAGLPEGVFAVVTGKGSEAGDALVRHPLVRKVSFTGSTEVGSQVMKLAASDVKRVSLELGGKSANVVFADADLDVCIPSSLWSAYDNAGQDCCARSRTFVEAPIYDEFAERFAKRVESIAVGEPLDR